MAALAAMKVAECCSTSTATFIFHSFSSSNCHRHGRRLLPKACSAHSTSQSPLPSLLRSDRRKFLTQSLSLSLTLSPLVGFAEGVKSEVLLSEWERVYLPVDRGVVLLDIAFVPDDPNHGISFSWFCFVGPFLCFL